MSINRTKTNMISDLNNTVAISVKQAPYNAAGDGVTDDTAAIQAAVDNGGRIYFPPGSYLISDAITCSSAVVLYGAGRDSTGITVGNNDCSAIILADRNSTIRDLSIDGSKDFGATYPALVIEPGCNNSQIENLFIQYGKYCVLNKGTDNTFFQNEFRYAFGSALMMHSGDQGGSGQGCSGNFVIRNKIDQVWPHSLPSNGYVINPWASTTAYSLGDIVTTDGWRIQCTGAGTSGGSAPTLLSYEQNISDGTATWQIAAPSDLSSVQIDSGASEIFLTGNDHSGAFRHCVFISNEQAENGSGVPFWVWIDNSIMGQHSGAGVFCGSGNRASITNSEIGVGFDTNNNTGVTTESTWGGRLLVVDNVITGGGSGDGVKIYGEHEGAIVSNNMFVGTLTRMVRIDTGFGTITDVVITGNNSMESAQISADETVADWYIITNNNTRGGGVPATSANSIVANNL